MRTRAKPPYAAIGWTGLGALLLAVYPMPLWLMPARPDWLGLFVVYWILRAPHYVGMGTAWLAGLLLDGIAGGLLGPRALALAVVAYFTLILRSRMLHYTLPQQMALVCALTAAGQLLCHWAQGIGGHSTASLWFLMSSLTSAFCWPIVSMGSVQRRAMEGWDVPA